jgi:predicted Na+-dependent transporter
MEFAAVALPLALGVIMFGLGLDLTPADFVRVAKQPKAAAVALACQLLLLPAICFGLVLLFRLPPILAVGMMLLAASPTRSSPSSPCRSSPTWPSRISSRATSASACSSARHSRSS